eukprot:Em0017g774a
MEFATEDELCEYEKKRLENIQRNCELLKRLGTCHNPGFECISSSAEHFIGLPLPGSVSNKLCDKSKRKKRQESSDEEDEWQPWMDEKVKRRCSARIEHKNSGVITNNCNLSPKRRGLKAGSEIDNASKSQDSEESGLKHHEKKEFAGFKAEQVSASHPKPHMIQYNDSNEDCDFEGFPVEEIKSALLQTIKDRYPRRCVRKGYKEEELSDEDEYLFCEDCNEVHHGDCPIHGPLVPFDESGSDTPSMLYTSMPIPAQLTVKPSNIPHAGLGIFPNITIAYGTRMGPYKGRIVTSEEMEGVEETSYMWEVKQRGQRAFYLDGSDLECSNWMRFVNCARNEKEQNMVAFQYRGQIYYRSFKEIPPGSELLVWYGEQYAKELGISVRFNFKQGITVHQSSAGVAVNPQSFKCGRCQETFTELWQLQSHIRQHIAGCEEKPCVSNTEKLYVCDYCGKAFTSNGDLKRHLQMVT